MSPTVFATAFIALYVAHQFADHWVQTSWQAATKGEPGVLGQVACLSHVLTYTLTAAVFLFIIEAVSVDATAPGQLWSSRQVLIALTVSAVTHYIADRRPLFEYIVIVTGQTRFYNLGRPRLGYDDNPSLGTGAYALDQSFHYVWLFTAAIILAW